MTPTRENCQLVYPFFSHSICIHTLLTRTSANHEVASMNSSIKHIVTTTIIKGITYIIIWFIITSQLTETGMYLMRPLFHDFVTLKEVFVTITHQGK